MTYKIVKRDTPNKMSRQGHIPDMIVSHITEGSYNGAVSWLMNPKSQASSHFVVSRKGEITQLVDISQSAWINGTSVVNSSDKRHYSKSTNKLVRERKTNANYYTVGIEHEGIYSQTRGELTPEQLKATIWLHKHIISEVKMLYGKDIPIDREHILGHYEITPITKPNCPGEKFQFDEIIKELKGIQENKVEEGTLYKVQVGAFSIPENANKLRDTLKKQGFETYIITEDGLYKVQVGAFSVRKNAENLMDKIKNFGHSPYIKVYSSKKPEVKSNYRKIREYNTDIHIFTVDKDHNIYFNRGERGKLETLSTIMKGEISKGKKVIAGVNCGFYSFNGSKEHYGSAVSDGDYYFPPSGEYVDFIYYKDGRTEIQNYEGYNKEFLNMIQSKAHFMIGTSYALVKDGKINLMNIGTFSSIANAYHPRTMLGQLDNGDIIVVVADGRSIGSKGLTSSQQAQLMLDLGCINAVNLDGGGSSTMCTVEDKNVVLKNKPSNTGGVERPIGSALIIYGK